MDNLNEKIPVISKTFKRRDIAKGIRARAEKVTSIASQHDDVVSHILHESDNDRYVTLDVRPSLKCIVF